MALDGPGPRSNGSRSRRSNKNRGEPVSHLCGSGIPRQAHARFSTPSPCSCFVASGRHGAVAVEGLEQRLGHPQSGAFPRPLLASGHGLAGSGSQSSSISASREDSLSKALPFQIHRSFFSLSPKNLPPPVVAEFISLDSFLSIFSSFLLHPQSPLTSFFSRESSCTAVTMSATEQPQKVLGMPVSFSPRRSGSHQMPRSR